MPYNPFSSAVTDLTNPQAQHWYRAQATLLMSNGWNSLQYLGLLLVNRINIQLGRPPLPALTAFQTPETSDVGQLVAESAITTIVDVEAQTVDLPEAPEAPLEVLPDVTVEPAAEAVAPEPVPVTLLAPDLEAMTVKELRSLARQHKITFDRPISKARKSQLVEALVGVEPVV